MDVDRLRQLQSSLDGPLMGDEALRERLERNYVWLESMARAWQRLAAEHDPALGRFIAPGRTSPANTLPEGPDSERVDLEPLKLASLARA